MTHSYLSSQHGYYGGAGKEVSIPGCPPSIQSSELDGSLYTPLEDSINNWNSPSNQYKTRYIRTIAIWWLFLLALIANIVGLIIYFIKKASCSDPLTIFGFSISAIVFYTGLRYISVSHYYPGKFRFLLKKIQKYKHISKCI